MLSANDSPIVDVIASGVHDTKNALFDAITRIQVASRQLRENGSGAGARADVPSLLDDARGALEQAIERLTHLLSAYRLSRQENPISQLPVVIDDLLSEALLRVPPISTAACPATTRNCAYAGIWLLDRELITDSLVNALQNARRHARNHVRISATAEDGWLKLCVEDDGPGFTPDFLSFRQSGPGIGLSVSARIAQLHCHRGRSGHQELGNGGALGGAVFTLWLP